MEHTENDWIPLKDFETKVMTKAAMRKTIFDRESNNAGYFLRRITKKWLISPAKFYEWIDKDGKISSQDPEKI